MSDVRLVDGTFDFAGGVDAGRVTTVQSLTNPHGLPRTKLAWAVNATMRNGGLAQRSGFQFLTTVHDGTRLYQGGWLYEPQSGNPYLVLCIGGILYAVHVDTDNSVTTITPSGQGLENPVTVPQCYMTQGEQFLVVQAGDWQPNNAGTLPLFYDGTTLRRSVGLTPGGSLTAELPPALAMTYYQGRIWYANGRIYTAGDIVGDTASGTLPYKFTDAVLKVTENPLAVGGDGFSVPSQAGNITALSYTAQLDASLGQGTLYAFTRKQIYGLFVPVTRSDWIAASANKQPQQVVAQTKFGTPSERSVVRVNGDLFYASPEPGIRSLVVAIRYFQQWANVSISRNVQRAMDFTTSTLMGTTPAINFDNRLLMGVLPRRTQVGVAFEGLVPLNFDLISTLDEQAPPAWEGMLDGIDVLQLFEGDFGGQQRAFAVVHNRSDHNIEVWEIMADQSNVVRDQQDNRVQWQVETPAFTFQKERDLKRLDGAEVWVDRIQGDVQMQFQYRQDASACWQNWAQTEFCAARNTCEDVNNPVCYPQQAFPNGWKFPIKLPRPREQECDTFNSRPVTQGYQFQMRIKIKGYCRIRGILMYAIPVADEPFRGINCQ